MTFVFILIQRKIFLCSFPHSAQTFQFLVLKLRRQMIQPSGRAHLRGCRKSTNTRVRVNIYKFPQKNKDYQIAVNAFRRLYHHDDGLLYVGSWAAGANVFDPENKNIDTVTNRK